jgi:vacuolar protein sorting-associated protein 11
VVTFEKRNEKNEKSYDKYFVQILDTVNQYIAFFEAYSKVEAVLTNDQTISLVVCNQKSERVVLSLLEKDNSFKIETFFKRSFYNEAWRFAKNQNCQESLLAEISRLHGDLLYSKSDFSGAIKQYTLTLGFVEPSYVIRRFLDVSQIDYLIEYLQRIHEKKQAKKEHTALLLNCYVKKQKIENLSHFLSESSLESDLFDIETAIKVCKDLQHYDEAMKLAEQKNKHELYLKILIENKKDYARSLEYIRTKVPLEEKEKYVIEFGQEFMKFVPDKTIELIKLLIRAHSISQVVRGKERDYVLSPEERSVFEQLNVDAEELENLTITTFKKPDEFFRLFIVNSSDLENFLLYLIKDVPKLPHEQIVFHRLIEFYLEMMKEHPSQKEEYGHKILEQLSNTTKKPDNNVLLSLFKMYDFD